METIIYTVRKGDTLFEIARCYGTTVGMIARYNGIVNPDLIYPDQILRIPVSEIPKIQRDRCALYATVDYIVKPGDTLFAIGERYGVKPGTLAEYNDLSDPDVLAVGQVLKIPVIQTERQHIVRKGDTLYAIAKMHHTTVETLAALNGIKDPDVIAEGQIIRLPTADALTTLPSSESETSVPSVQGEPVTTSIPSGQAVSSEPGTYTVQKGDTLWKIARKYHVTVASLINRNRLTQPDLLIPGTVLQIPS